MVSVTHKHESARDIQMSSPSWTFFPPPSSSHPSRHPQSTSFGFPASSSKLPLAIYFIYGAVCFHAFLVAHSDGKESPCNVADLGLIPGLERSPGEGNTLEKSMGLQREGTTERPTDTHIPTNSARALPFLHTLCSTYCLYIFWWWPFWLV